MKWLLVIFFIMSIYPPAELTRYILAYITYNGGMPPGAFLTKYLEITFIWVAYITALICFVRGMYEKR